LAEIAVYPPVISSFIKASNKEKQKMKKQEV